MKTCEKCKHYTASEDKRYPNDGECDCDKFVYDEEAPPDGIQYWDYEGYSAGMKIGPHFGCIHWIKKG